MVRRTNSGLAAAGNGATISPATTVTGPDAKGGGGYGQGQTWHTVTFVTSHVLSTGSTYHLVLSTSAGTEYWTMIIRDGSGYGFNSVTYFADGNAQIATNGTTFTNVLNESGNPDSTGDLQFYFATT